MTALKIFDDNNPNIPIFDSNTVSEADKIEKISHKLKQIGIRFEQWQTIQNLISGATQEEVLKAYKSEIDQLINEEGYVTVDVVSLTSDNPNKSAFREKFLNEHTHSEDEVRFFVDGEGLFSLHIDNQVFEILCSRGDLISVPANTRHWFDMGENPNFTAIRFFNNPEGWVANFTGSDIASQFSRLEN
ncbi:1,2-dihydroxy-3-keto-5-methylthiopentene dioxygenase [Geminocystis sp. NIES-3708]|uniref:1,2-dihydroxy-3-keto-5-methylthiopentene dioxygenase n=1 Tax=Geminocystis sp. NIES-3708 TaxID=1615909 RepID=UPI0005FC5EBE|nr:cupin domain-containing protein [Geminocystis sp. NIES-3708]BAQ61297.1 1,2-dihydroxy-3-keto-5-methylthiopentene dioxygenase [Geminocystis sp. NIES-3708]